MPVTYLETLHTVTHAKRTDTIPRYGVDAYGYTLRSGAPTSYMVKLDNRGPWRRVMVWQFSNAGTAFVRVNGKPLVVRNETSLEILANKQEQTS